MFKVLVLLKRKKGMSLDEFINYYETKHSALGVKYQTKMKRYIRHYLKPIPYPLDGSVQEPEYDVLTELWFDDQKAFEDGMALMRAPEANAVLSEDEKNLFDLSKNCLVAVEDHESDLPWMKAGGR